MYSSHCSFVEIFTDAAGGEFRKESFPSAGEGPDFVGGGRENVCVTESPLAAAQRLFAQAVDALRGVAEAGAPDERVSVLRLCESTARRLDQVTVATVAGLDRDGVFAERGYKSATRALSDLLGWEHVRGPPPGDRGRAGRPADGAGRLGVAGPAAGDRAGVRPGPDESAACRGDHPAAGRPAGRAVEPAAVGGRGNPARPVGGRLHPDRAAQLGQGAGRVLDQDGEEPDDRPPARTNELFLSRLPDGGGKLKGRFDDAGMFDAIAAVIDAHAKPLTGDDDRGTGQRQAEALADVCGYVLDHGPTDLVPECGGHRPHVNVLIRLGDLQNRARAGCLDFGGPVAPESLRMLCCDAAVVPIVMNGQGQPLDVGRTTRTIPDGLRRAVAARDRGCAHPGCGRPPSWCEVHQLSGSTAARRSCRTWLCCAGFIIGRSIPRNGSADPRRSAGVHPASMDRPDQRPRRRALPHLAAGR